MATLSNDFSTAVCRAPSSSGTVRELDRQLSNQTTPPSLAVLFVSYHHADSLPELVAAVTDRIGTENVIGCTGESIVARAQEIEGEPAVALWMAWIPEAVVELMHLQFERTADGGVIQGWPDDLQPDDEGGSTLLVLGEPYSFPADYLLEQINQDRPATQVLGGMASGVHGPGERCLFLRKRVLSGGAVAVLLRNVKVTAVVSQGCRPIGPPLVITQAERNVVYQLGGKNALWHLKKIYDQLPNCDKELVRQGVHLGRVVNEYQERFDFGDFLIRNVTGIDAEEGSLLVGDYMRVGQTVRFHVRDASTAHEDMKQLLHRTREQAECPPRGALLFNCTGRGSRLFDEPHHDARLIAEICSEASIAGCFCQGEMGPIGGKSFLHGFTASIGLFH